MTIFANGLRDTFYKNIATSTSWMEAIASLTEAIASVIANKPIIIFLMNCPGWLELNLVATSIGSLLEYEMV